MSESQNIGPSAAGRERILLVEDDQGLANLLSEELEDSGYQVSIAFSAEAAEDLLKTREPDLVVSDLKLPGEDGMTL
ncbi:MAG: response regulator, partial [Desulfobacterales bacterium]|nr:response regulator [Desulfobacterales bacterium]